MEKNNEKTNGFQTCEKFKHKPITIGCTIGRDWSSTNIINLKKQGIKCFQIMAKFSRFSGEYVQPLKLLQDLRNTKIILHMPFYFHLLQKPNSKYDNYFLSMNNYWKKIQCKTMVVAHCKGVNKPKFETANLLYSNVSRYSRLCPEMRIQIENDAGGKFNPAPKLNEIVDVRRRLKNNKKWVGVCLDTEHAYASGDDLFSVNYAKNITLIHLNAIPQDVVFGKHLDRHSLTPLSKSKNGIGFVTKILAIMKKKTPLILERTDYNVVLNDLTLLKRLSHENLLDVDKKTVSKNLQKRTKIFF